MKLELVFSEEFKQDFKELVRDVLKEELNYIPKQEPIPENELISRNEALALLKCSHSTLYRYQRDGIVPYFKAGSKVLFNKIELLAVRIYSSIKL